MSINIKAPILKIAESIVVTVPIANLSKNQIKSLIKFALSGIIIGDSVPAQIARQLRRAHNQSYINRAASSNWTRWYNLADDELDEIYAAAVVERLTHGDACTQLSDAINRTSSGSIYTDFFDKDAAARTQLHTCDKLRAFCSELADSKISLLTYDLLSEK